MNPSSQARVNDSLPCSVYAREAAGRIRKLHPQVKQEGREAIRAFLDTPLSGHSLQEELFGYRSYRVRAYRIIYRLNDEERTIDVVFVGPRQNVYEELLSLVRGPSFRNGVHRFLPAWKPCGPRMTA
jgi:mRNA-degrading endonuclease RelE of RelBE toxin-antitoxin system